jgi:hypothetical protein
MCLIHSCLDHGRNHSVSLPFAPRRDKPLPLSHSRAKMRRDAYPHGC